MGLAAVGQHEGQAHEGARRGPGCAGVFTKRTVTQCTSEEMTGLGFIFPSFAPHRTHHRSGPRVFFSVVSFRELPLFSGPYRVSAAPQRAWEARCVTAFPVAHRELHRLPLDRQSRASHARE